MKEGPVLFRLHNVSHKNSQNEKNSHKSLVMLGFLFIFTKNMRYVSKFHGQEF